MRIRNRRAFAMIVIAAMVFVAAGVAGCTVDGVDPGSPTRAPADSDNRADAPSFDAEVMEALVHGFVNEQRAAHGLALLGLSEPFATVARGHSADMAERDYFAHENPGGEDATARGARVGIACDGANGAGIGENLALTALYDGIATYTYPDYIEELYDWRSMEQVAANVVEGWMNSPGHRSNILDPGWAEHGVGVVMTPDFEIYISDNFC